MSGGLRAFANDLGRSAIAVLLRLAGWAAVLRHRVRLSVHPLRERRLRRRFGIGPSAGITRSLPEAEAGAGDSVALTSGTAGEPKRVPYSGRRLAATRAVFVDGMLRLVAARRVRRPSLYVFGALDPDRSLSSLLVRERRTPPWFVLLQAPYRAQSDPALLELKERYGASALRLLVLTLANPGMLYATNPSTLSGFLEEVEGEWEAAAALVRFVVRDPDRVSPAARRILRRLASRGSRDRLGEVAESASPLPITAWNPAFTTYVCWTGGAVTPFLERLDRRLPAPRFRREPMYSMSTETVATIPDYRRKQTAFLPAAPGVLHEFLPASEGCLLGATALEPGGTYEMVVSHRFGPGATPRGISFGSSGSWAVSRTSASSAGAAWAGPSPAKNSPSSRWVRRFARWRPNTPACATAAGWRCSLRIPAARRSPATASPRWAGIQAASRVDCRNASTYCSES